MAQDVNKATAQKGIIDEAAKIEILRSMQGNPGRGSLENIASQVILLRADLFKLKDGAFKEYTKELAAINKGINSLLGRSAELLAKSKTDAAQQDTQLQGALEPGKTVTEAAGSKSSVANADENLTIAIGGIKDAIVTAMDVNTSAVQESAQVTAASQQEVAKAVVTNETKRQQAESRNTLVNADKKKQVGGDDKKKKKKEKLAMPKFPLNGKQFMSGLGKILRGILNPVAMIAGVFMHLLPYILLAVAFFKGFWSKLGPRAKKVFLGIRDKIIEYAIYAFLLFKAPALLIATLQVAWFIIKTGFLAMKWLLELAFHSIRTLFAGTEHGMKMSETMFERLCSMIEHIAKMITNAIENGLNLAAFALKVAAIVIVVALFVLLIAGVLILFVLFNKEMCKAVDKLIEVFQALGTMIGDVIITFLDSLGKMLVFVVDGILKSISEYNKEKRRLDREEAEAAKNNNTAIKNDDTNNIFVKALKPIKDILDDINKCLAPLKDIAESKRLNRGPLVFNDVAESSMNVQGSNTKIRNTMNADNIQANVNTNYVAAQRQDDLNIGLRDNVDKIRILLDKWDRNNNTARNARPSELKLNKQ